jgi:hypothetical protein
MKRTIRRSLPALALLCALLAGEGVAAKTPKTPKPPRVPPVAPVADSVTVALWRFDENGGPRAADAGARHLDGTAGMDSRTEFGRYHSARRFERSVDSWVIVPYSPAFEGHPGFTIEAWVRVDSVATHELQVIAARWSPVPNQQGWVFGISGRNLAPPEAPPSPGWFRSVTGFAPAQRLVFGYQPQLAAAPIGCYSTSELPLGRWVHVAASLDGEVVRLYIDGQLDSQLTSTGPVRPTEAPLLLGSAFDPRHLTEFGGDLRMDPNAAITVYYPLIGALDEVRLSGVARARFESAPLH